MTPGVGNRGEATTTAAAVASGHGRDAPSEPAAVPARPYCAGLAVAALVIVALVVWFLLVRLWAESAGGVVPAIG
jgi:hypothetical protein